MKQRRHGKTVYNWHRPLGHSQLRRRFLRARERSNSVEEALDIEHDDTPLADLRIWPHEIADYCCEACYQQSQGYADEEDTLEFKLRSLLDTLLHPPNWLLELDQAKAQLPSPEPSRIGEPTTEADNDSIEHRLAHHIDKLSSEPDRLRSILEDKISDNRSLRKISRAGISIGNRHFPRLILLFSPFWIRDPLDFSDSGDPHDLLSFLFVKHEAPGFLFPAWLSSKSLHEAHLKWVLWLIIIGQGGSLKRSSRYFPWTITGKYQRHLSTAPEHFSPRDAALLSEVKRISGTRTTYQRLTRFAFFVFDPTEPGYTQRTFWEETVRWLSKHEAELNDDESHDILQWAIHERIESERGPRALFSWKNRSVSTCQRKADTYLTSIQLGDQHLRWKSQGWNLDFTDNSGLNWSIVELLNGRELAQESRLMRHCVSTYSIRCHRGHAAIFSLRKNGTREITVEIDLHKKSLAQARGKLNRPAMADELVAINQWLKEIGLTRPE